MKKWVTLEECTDKTVSRMLQHAPERWLLAFTDGTWTSVKRDTPFADTGRTRQHLEAFRELDLVDTSEYEQLAKHTKMES